MALSRRVAPHRAEWEVDHSELSVSRPFGKREWRVHALFQRLPDAGYLERHALKGVSYPTRARAVDAVRLALAAEPRHSRTLTQWGNRSESGLYASSDGHWRLRRGERAYSLLPRSSEARAALQQRPAGEAELSWSASFTLEQCAQRADRINFQLRLFSPARKSAELERTERLD